jgi:hypothetical protein
MTLQLLGMMLLACVAIVEAVAIARLLAIIDGLRGGK